MSKSQMKPSIPWSSDNKAIDDAPGKKAIPSPSPSASVIVVSGSNKVLLLHRKKTSSAFPSAHVFPGGNLDAADGFVPEAPTNPERHKDSIAYRTGAIRELFEESGVLLARETGKPGQPLLTIDKDTRLAGRNDVHGGKISLQDWLHKQSPTAVLDTEPLIPFTHWITPTNVPKRFTTQMYVYFVPVTDRRHNLLATADQVETMTPEWLTSSSWTARADKGEIILFPPQYILLHLMAGFLDKAGDPNNTRDVPEAERENRREQLRRFILNDKSPEAWTHKYISPAPMKQKWHDGRQVLDLYKPGPELKDSDLKGDSSKVVLVQFSKEGPRRVEVKDRQEVMQQLEKSVPKDAKL